MYLGIDLGTSSVKTLLIREDQTIVGSGGAHLDVSRPQPGWSEQNPADWIRATKEAIAALKDRHPKEFAAIAGIGLSGHMHGATVLGGDDEPLRPCILWNDTRSHAEASALDADPRFRRITGNIVFPGFTAPKLVWMRNNEPDLFAKVRRVLLPKDYLRLWLTGEALSEMSDSAGTSWLDVGARRWSRELLDATNLAESTMPGLVEGTEQAGTLRAELAAEWGLAQGIPVAGGAGDNAASACGMGTVAESNAFVSLGTSGVLFAANASYLPNPESAVHTFCHALPNAWHQMGVILSATDSLNWLSTISGKQAADLTEQLGIALRKPTGVTFLPYLSGERTPHNDAAIRGSFTGLGHESDLATLTQAVLEGIAFAFRDCLEALRAAGTELTRVTAIGGGSRSQYWLKSIATALDLPIDVPADGDYGAAFGAARLGLIAATGADPLSVCTAPRPSASSNPVRSSARHTPTPTPAIARSIRRSGKPHRKRPSSIGRPLVSGSSYMTTGFFGDIAPVKYEGPDSTNPLAYRFYNKDEVVMGKRMEDHLRFAVAYWHSFAWPGGDPFGGQTFDRPWFGDTMDAAKLKADVAFEMFSLLGVPFYCFHDADVRPEGKTFAESAARLDEIADVFARKQQETGVKLLWGTANLFSHRRFMAGAATNPDPDVFAYAAATVKSCIDVTKRLGGQNYVLWGGREGYETLLNTDLKREREQAGRFLSMVVDYKKKIGFKGTILIEPKPQEPTKHQYDYDVATVYGFLKDFGLEKEVKVNIEQGHAILAGHSFEHELALAASLGIFGSIDMNRNDYQSGWDTDQFPNNVPEMALAFYYVLQAGGFKTGGTNFDAKLRRQSLDPQDLLIAHIGGMDCCARGLKAAARMIEDKALSGPLEERYAGWKSAEGRAMLSGKRTLEEIAERVVKKKIEPQPRSGRQELLENIVNRYGVKQKVCDGLHFSEAGKLLKI